MAEIVPIYNVVILPHATVILTAKSYQETTGKVAKQNEEVYFAIAKNILTDNNFTTNNFYDYGVSGVISEISDNAYVVIKTYHRILFVGLHIDKDHHVSCLEVHKANERNDLYSDDYDERMQGLKDSLIQFMSQYRWAIGAKSYIQNMDSPEEIITGISQLLPLSANDKYELLRITSRRKRFLLIEKYILEYTEMNNVSSAASSAQEAGNRKIYREMAIKKQIEYLQKELDEMHPENISEIRKLEKRIKDSAMNEIARKESEKTLARMQQEGENSTEYDKLYDYLDFLCSLNWAKEKAVKIDIQQAQHILDEKHSGLKKVKKRILEQIAIMNLKQKQSGSILLFVGPPGTGKTSVGKSIAFALNRPYARISLGGVQDSSDIFGFRRTYVGSMPGRIMDAMQKANASNPVMVLDEIDKLSSSYHGDPAAALLEVLDPEQNKTFVDHYMNVPYDLSDVFFICTANSLDTIPEPLLNRMEIIEFQGYSALEKFAIAKNYLLPNAMADNGIKETKLVITDDIIKKIIDDYTMESGVRGLKQELDKICRYTALKIVEGRKTKLVISQKKLNEILDERTLEHNIIHKKTKAGIVTGLAWTPTGGEILFIETLKTVGKGNLHITGQLGSVMQESVQIALSLVKYLLPNKEKEIENSDLHIHFPSGAVKKDGPSAGITITTALASLLTNHKVDPSIAMTGEVSLRGDVMPIGGLVEKLMAAARAGVKTVLIPKDNEQDLKDVPKEVKDQLKIIPVLSVCDVLHKVGISLK